MTIQSKGQFDRTVSDVEQAGRMLTAIEGIIIRRDRLTLADARQRICRSVKTTIGTIGNIHKQRRKTVPHSLMGAIRQELIALLQTEIMRLENEILIHRQIAGGHRSDDLAAAEAQVEAARKTLRSAAR